MSPASDDRGRGGSDKAPKRLLYYERHGRVTRRDLMPDDSERLRIIRANLPQDVVSILDVGCGVGLLTRTLAATHRVVGIDISRDVHRGAAEPRVCGSASALPFRSESFDCVLATQIVEHLSDGELEAVGLEMARVSRRYVLITTTLGENLAEASVPCPACGTLFNVYGHLRTFGRGSLALVVPGYSCVFDQTYAPAKLYPRVLVTINQKILGFWHYELALMCTQCGRDQFPRGRRGLAWLSLATNALVRILPRRQRPTRILMLFKKTEGPACL